MRAFGRIWDQVTRERYGIENPKQRRFRYGVQVNSLGLTEAQPENNIQRIVLEMLAVTLSKDARARAVQLPAWNEALGLPRPWDQQWSLRIQQVLALRERPAGVRGHLRRVARRRGEGGRAGRGVARRDRPDRGDGRRDGRRRVGLSEVAARRLARRAAGPYRVRSRRRSSASTSSSRPSRTRSRPTSTRRSMTVDPAVEARVRRRAPGLARHARPAPFNHPRPCKALERLKEAAKGTDNLMEATLECARAGVTTGEWAGALREVFGEFRAPTGVSSAPVAVTAEEGTALAAGPPQGGAHGAGDGRRQAPLPGRQAGPGRALQRRRADRRTGP